jgi:hypothetical protein
VAEFLTAYQQGAKWPAAFRQVNLNPDFYARRAREEGELLPWDFIDHGVRKSYLWEEWQRALEGRETSRCQVDICHRCGVC